MTPTQRINRGFTMIKNALNALPEQDRASASQEVIDDLLRLQAPARNIQGGCHARQS